LPGSHAAEDVTVVYGVEGGTISVNCSYNPWQQWWREKSWCRQTEGAGCQRVVSARRFRRFWLPSLHNRNGTTSIQDNIHGLLTVTIQQLQKEDAGLYQCRTDYPRATSTLRKVQVEVLAAGLETQMPEEPRAVQSISSTPAEADFTILYITTGLLAAKFLVAVLIFMLGSRGKSRETEQHPRLNEQQDLPFAAALAQDEISPSWESSA
ncbi:TREM2 protein, partial [Alcedo cyanopectus]|nr:TREM2 protein [Ceyx cyanopectus]